jgi:hypothetical protein
MVGRKGEKGKRRKGAAVSVISGIAPCLALEIKIKDLITKNRKPKTENWK